MESRDNNKKTLVDEPWIDEFISIVCEFNQNKSQRDLIIQNFIEFVRAVNSEKAFPKKIQLISQIKIFNQNISLVKLDQNSLSLVALILQDIENDGKLIKAALEEDHIDDLISRLKAIVEKNDANKPRFIPKHDEIKTGIESDIGHGPVNESRLFANYKHTIAIENKINEELAALTLLIQEVTHCHTNNDLLNATEKCKTVVDLLERLHIHFDLSNNPQVAAMRNKFTIMLSTIILQCGAMGGRDEESLKLLEKTIETFIACNDGNLALEADLSFLQITLGNFYFKFTKQPDQCYKLFINALEQSRNRIENINKSNNQIGNYPFELSIIQLASYSLFNYYIDRSERNERLASGNDINLFVDYTSQEIQDLNHAVACYENFFQKVTPPTEDIIAPKLADIYEKLIHLYVIMGDIHKKNRELSHALDYYNAATNFLQKEALRDRDQTAIEEEIQKKTWRTLMMLNPHVTEMDKMETDTSEGSEYEEASEYEESSENEKTQSDSSTSSLRP